ncbi:RNA-guided pseudouridylation complex pseudouridine synthase subunit Cbf5 [Candidatus Pacearchaeota archaeon]|nr:RNA-guided pseudouridylation complex pseudouridine synthase subunit Cbf5 [Candidatus Pacearchaeota archaeon]
MINLSELKSKKSIKELLEFGIINIDKPSGPTSFNVSEFVMKKLNLRKTSHFGTLDPKVTGVLPIALNRACKLTGYFLGEDKAYVGIMRLHDKIPMEKLREVIKEKFTGKIKQTPPVKSRVARIEREREIKNFEILEQDGKDFLFLVHVQGGTYIRKLCDDLGKELEIGAHMLELRRIRAGIFEENSEEYPSGNLYDFEKAVDEYKNGNEKLLREMIIPGEIITKLHPIVEIDEECAERVLRGQPIYEKNLVKRVKIEEGKKISAFSGDRFIGMFRVVNEGGIFAKSEFTMQEMR